MPLLSRPRIFLGAKFATIVTCFPTISSGLKCIAIPDSMVLCSNPRSTNSSNNLSAFSTFLASMIVPTRKSILPKSSNTISGLRLLSFGFSVLVFSIVVFLAATLACNCASSASISSFSIFLKSNSGARKV